MRTIAICSFLLLTLPCATGAFAQNAPQTAANKAPDIVKAAEPPVHYYHLDLVVKEIGEDGKPVNSRAYSCTVSTERGEYDSIRIGSRVPIATGSYSGSNAGSPVQTQFQYMDVGVKFDARDVRQMENKLALSLQAQISSLGAGMRMGGASGVEEPVVRQNSWNAQVLIPIGKPTIVFTSDDVDSKGGMEVVVTATPLQ